MGDPETEVVIPRIKSDFLNLLKGIKDGTFSEKDLEINEDVASTVMLVSEGYPEKYEKGFEISRDDTVAIVRGSVRLKKSWLDLVSRLEKTGITMVNSREVVEISSD